MTAPHPKPVLLRRVRALVGRAALVLVSVTAALFLAEVIVRLVVPQQLILIRPDLWQPTDTVGWTHRPNAAVRINTGERTVAVYTDPQGFRVGKERRLPPSRKRVLLLGDSFMEALQVEHEATLAYLLQNELSGRLGEPVAVMNAGIGGWDMNQYLLHARTLLARDSFALVVASIFVGNDAVPSRRQYFPPRKPVERNRFHVPRRLGWSEFVSAVPAPINDFLEVRSHLYVLLKNQLATLRMRLGITADYFPDEYRRAEVDSPRWRVTAEVAQDLKRAASSSGAATLFVLVPENIQVYGEDLERYLRGFGIDSASIDVEQPTRRLSQSFSAAGLNVLDALPAFRAAAASGPKLYGSVDHHLSPAGHRVLADLLAPTAAELLQR